MENNAAPFQYRVGHLGNPNSNDPFRFWKTVPWSKDNLQRLKSIGFNAIQVNVAWGPRPDDEPLNLEDVVALPPDMALEFPQPVPLNCDPSPAARERRRAEVRERSAACKALGLRTIFHFGAPYNAHMRYGDGPPNCLSDEKMLRRYEILLDIFAGDFPDIDDILVYTYDQDAWLCSEFGPCPRCLGIPLHKRVVNFLDRLAQAWRRTHPEGRLWWEPWELSAGQVYACVAEMPQQGIGLALHANVAEVMAAHPADRWLKNTAGLAGERGIPVIVEYWLGGPCEEQEPLLYLAHPLVTWRGLRSIAAVPGVCGIKEYYGLDPDREDPNLRMTALFLANPELSDAEALAELARPYGQAAEEIVQFWRLTSQGMELFPWEVSWYVRQIGRSRVDHALSAASIRGMPCRTPSWCSTRQEIFMVAYEYHTAQDPWLREDIELRCRAAVDAWGQALTLGGSIQKVAFGEANQQPAIGGSEQQPAAGSLAGFVVRNLVDLGRLRRRALAYAFHLRETNLANMLREYPGRVELATELRQCLVDDLANYQAERQAEEEARKLEMIMLSNLAQADKLEPMPAWGEAEEALALLDRDPGKFLLVYFGEAEDTVSKGVFSVTSK